MNNIFKKPRISVITASKNAAATLVSTLSSVIDQEYADLEYIVIDAASTDHTPGILDQYRIHLTFLISEPDNGIYDAFNKGLRLATGDIIGILNADDQYAPWTLETIAKMYQTHPNYDVFYGKLAVLDEQQRRWTIYPLGNHEQLLDHMSIAHPATFVTRRMYEKYGFFDERYKIAGDWDLILRLYLAGENFCSVDKVLTAFGNSGISSKQSRQLMKENRMIYMKYLQWRAALKKIVGMEIKYRGRRLLERMGLYDLYGRYRDSRILCVEGRGIYEDSDSLWAAIEAVENKAGKLL